jgi:competence protein ComEC
VPVLERYRVDTVVFRQLEIESATYDYWLQLLVAGGATLASTVLKAPHHGSCSSTTEEFLAAVDPEVVVISVGADNDFGPPCAGVLERLEGWAMPVYRTDEQGVVEIVTDGARVWVETER